MTDEQGSFEIDAPVGGVLLVARSEGYVSEQRNVLVRPGRGNVPVHFTLSPSGSVLGRVVDLNGHGVAGARVWLLYRGAERSWSLAEESGGEETDEFGYFTIPVVAQGRPFVLLAENDTWLLSSSGTITLRGRELSGITLLLSRRGSTVSGRVVDSLGQPVPGAEVRLRAIPSDTEFTAEQRMSVAFARTMHKAAVAGPDGFYTFASVPGGRVVVTTDANRRRAAAEATISSGQPATLNLVLPR
jgi:hypothetical protein